VQSFFVRGVETAPSYGYVIICTLKRLCNKRDGEMSSLTPKEKLFLESLLGMQSGYVLSFTNATFQEFVQDIVQIDIYDPKYQYQSGSKANRLRAFWNLESDPIAGKLTAALLEHWETEKLLQRMPIDESTQVLLDKCKMIVMRLQGIISADDTSSQKNKHKDQKFRDQQTALLREFDAFSFITDPQQKRQRGYWLENFLFNVFSLYNIPVEASFKRNEGGEQIDGAFKLGDLYYLVECKWTEKLTDIRQLDTLLGKLHRSGKQTMGLFLSINGWSENVVPLLKQNGEKSIILMDGYDLRCVLDENFSLGLEHLLQAKLKHLNLYNEPFYGARNLLPHT
jgi:hypothetical protein